MKLSHILIQALLVVPICISADEVGGFLKFMHAGAQNQDKSIDRSSSVLGIELGYEKDFTQTLSAGITFMDVEVVGSDKCTRIIGSKYTGSDGFGVLGEAFVKYEDDKNIIKLGRQKINTPLLASNPTGMTYETFVHAGTFEAITLEREFNPQTSLNLAYITRYKQRTSDRFYDIGENITGNDSLKSDYIAVGGLTHNTTNKIKLQFWGLKADNLLNSYYFQADKAIKVGDYRVAFGIQGLSQKIDDKVKSLKNDDSSLIGAKVAVSKSGTKIMVAFSKTGSNQIVLPWDGTPAFTKLCVTNTSTKSIKGLGLSNYAGAYGANTKSVKVALIQDFSTFGISGLKGVLAYGQYSPSSALVTQKNKMAYLKYNLYHCFHSVKCHML